MSSAARKAPDPALGSGDILVVDDDAEVAETIAQALLMEGHPVRCAGTIAEARAAIARRLPALLLLDRILPDGEGGRFCAELRASPRTAGVGIVLLSARGAASDRLAGLRQGGDDYVSKPFNVHDLVARIHTVLRAKAPQPVMESRGLRVEPSARRASLRGKVVPLGGREFDLLCALLERPGRLLGRGALAERVWGAEAALERAARAVDSAVASLKSKLGGWGGRIASVRGEGFRLEG